MIIDLEMDVAERIVSDECVSDLRFDRLLAGELGPEERKPIDGHVQGCGPCQNRFLKLQAQHEEFPQKVWISGLAMQVLRGNQRRKLHKVMAIAATVAMCVVGVSVLQRAGPSQDGIRPKGEGPKLEVFARHDDGRVEEVAPGAALAPGTALRFRITTKAAGFVGVVGLDNAGVVSGYYPEQGPLLPVSGASQQMLDGSVILDDTPGVERLFAVLCEEQLDVSELVQAATTALQTNGDDPSAVRRLGVKCEQATFLFSKRIGQ
jgi:hypothetical protein